jgi:hypothetical protein
MPENCEWVHIGDVVIESGRLALVDPVLADHVVNLEGDGDVVVGAPGLLVSTGLGDGSYPVLAHYMDVEGIGRRLTAVEVTFLDHEEVPDG